MKCTVKCELWEIGYVRPIIRCHNRSQQWNWRRSRIEIAPTFSWMNKNDEKTSCVCARLSRVRVSRMNSVKVSFRVARFVFVWRARNRFANSCTFGRIRDSWFFSRVRWNGAIKYRIRYDSKADRINNKLNFREFVYIQTSQFPNIYTHCWLFHEKGKHRNTRINNMWHSQIRKDCIWRPVNLKQKRHPEDL